VDLDTGDRTVIAQSLPGDPEPFFNPVSLAYDDQTIPGSPRLIVADLSGTISKIIQIDLASGIRTPFVPTGVSLGTPIAMKLDAARDRLLVVDERSNRLLAVDLSTTDLTVVGSNEDGLGESLDPTYGIAIKTSSEPKIFTGQVLGEVLSTDITTRARSTLVASRLGTGPRMPLVSSVVVEQSDGAATSLLAADLGKLVRIDLASGNRTLISDNFMEGGAPAGGIADIAIDRRASAHAPSALALLFGMQSLVSVDLSTGQIAQAANLDSADPPVTHPWSMALDAPANRVLFISQDTAPGALDAIYEIELSSGTRRTITDIDTGTGPSLIEAVDLVLEPTPTPTRAIVSDNVQGALLWVDLSTGHRSELTPLGQAFRPGQLFLDSGNGRVIGYDHAGHGALFAADLATGHRHVISGNDLFDVPKGSGPLLGNAQGLDVDTFSQVAFVTDMASGAVLAVDLLTGERVIVAH
jgi:hypothetical protein